MSNYQISKYRLNSEKRRSVGAEEAYAHTHARFAFSARHHHKSTPDVTRMVVRAGGYHYASEELALWMDNGGDSSSMYCPFTLRGHTAISERAGSAMTLLEDGSVAFAWRWQNPEDDETIVEFYVGCREGNTLTILSMESSDLAKSHKNDGFMCLWAYEVSDWSVPFAQLIDLSENDQFEEVVPQIETFKALRSAVDEFAVNTRTLISSAFELGSHSLTFLDDEGEEWIVSSIFDQPMYVSDIKRVFGDIGEVVSK